VGKLLVAEEQGACILRLVGDVRVNLCRTFDEFIKSVDCDGRDHVIVDLGQAENLDSTTLGLLAKLALYCKTELDFELQIFCPSPDVTTLLESMGIQQIANIEKSVCSCNEDKLHELDELNCQEQEAKQHVIDAHRILMSLNEQNQDKFKDLVSHLQAC